MTEKKTLKNADQTQVIFVEKETGDIIWKKF